MSRGRLKPPVGWAAVGGVGTVAGIGFTVSLLIATLAFEGEHLEEAKIGILASACIATLLTWLVFRVTAMLPKRRKLQALLGTAEPLNDVHPHAQLAAEAAEAAARQGSFWEMHDLLLSHQDALRAVDLRGYAEALGLDVDRFVGDLHDRAGAARVSDDIDGAELSDVSGTPTFFINGLRHHGAYDIDTLSTAVSAALARAAIAR
jgi:hypothetical protein